MVEAARRDGLTHRQQIGELHHLIVAAAHVNIGDVVRVGSIHIRHLHNDIVLLAVVFEACHLAPAEHGFERAADCVHIDADVSDLVAIDGNL